jgi:hypothetical protein
MDKPKILSMPSATNKVLEEGPDKILAVRSGEEVGLGLVESQKTLEVAGRVRGENSGGHLWEVEIMQDWTGK